MTHEFRATIKSNEISAFFESAIQDYNKESDEIVYLSDMIVVWQVEYEIRSWGIKSAIVSVINFEFTVMQDDYTDSDTGETLKGFEKTFTNHDFKIEVNEDDFTFDSVSIEACDIDFKDNTIEFF